VGRSSLVKWYQVLTSALRKSRRHVEWSRNINHMETFESRSYVVKGELVAAGPEQDVSSLFDVVGPAASKSPRAGVPCRAVWRTSPDLDRIGEAVDAVVAIADKIPDRYRVELRKSCKFEVNVFITFIVEYLEDEHQSVVLASYGVDDLPFISPGQLSKVAKIPARLWLYH
jgi:hypothetical protein